MLQSFSHALFTASQGDLTNRVSCVDGQLPVEHIVSLVVVDLPVWVELFALIDGTELAYFRQ